MDFPPDDDHEPTFHVYTRSYCGMVIPHGEFDLRSDAVERAKARVKWCVKHGCNVDTRLPDWGKGLEIGEPDNCMMVPDFCGTLYISTNPPRL